MNMDEILAFILIIVICAVAGAMCIGFYVYYKKYHDLKDHKRKWVVLRDFEGHVKRLGIHHSYGDRDNQFTIIVVPEEGADYVEEWLIHTPFTFENVSREYKSVDYWELTVFTDFKKSDFKQRIIEPLFDVSILELGLTRGIQAIEGKNNPLYKQIAYLKDSLSQREEELRATQIALFEERLKFLKESKFAYKHLLDEVGNEIIMAPKLLTAKIRGDRQSYTSYLKRFAETTRQGMQGVSASESDSPEGAPSPPRKTVRGTE